MLRIVIILIFASSISGLSGQGHYLLDKFIVYKENERVILNWTIKKGNTCFGIGIFRSTDNANYKLIGDIKGICGSSDDAISYTYIDENPVGNRTNYYVLELGFSGKTNPPLKVEFVNVSDKGYKIFPNPITEKSKIYFSNKINSNFTLNIYDLSGNRIQSLKTNQDYFELSLLNQNSFFSNLLLFSDPLITI